MVSVLQFIFLTSEDSYLLGCAWLPLLSWMQCLEHLVSCCFSKEEEKEYLYILYLQFTQSSSPLPSSTSRLSWVAKLLPGNQADLVSSTLLLLQNLVMVERGAEFCNQAHWIPTLVLPHIVHKTVDIYPGTNRCAFLRFSCLSCKMALLKFTTGGGMGNYFCYLSLGVEEQSRIIPNSRCCLGKQQWNSAHSDHRLT